MPAIYAHHAFGREVKKNLPADLKALVRRFPDYYEIGLQGPDILFFYKFYEKNRVNQTGYRIHEEEAALFLEQGRKVVKEKGLSSPECAYLLGFLCHFMLDSACHPYVAKQMEKHGVGHVALESEFEKYVLRRDGKDALSYPMGWLVPAGKGLSGSIAPFYEGITEEEIEKALRDMKLCKTILVAPGKGKRRLLLGIMRLIGKYDELSGHMLRPGTDPRCRESNAGLWERLQKEVPETVTMLETFYGLLSGEEALPARLYRNFE